MDAGDIIIIMTHSSLPSLISTTTMTTKLITIHCLGQYGFAVRNTILVITHLIIIIIIVIKKGTVCVYHVEYCLEKITPICTAYNKYCLYRRLCHTLLYHATKRKYRRYYHYHRYIAMSHTQN